MHALVLHAQAKFGISGVALTQLETYTSAVLLATLRPPAPPKHEEWRTVMKFLSKVGRVQRGAAPP